MNDRHLHDALEKYFGYHEFRPLQQEIIQDVLDGKDTFVLMPTGGGKSLCYQLPALLMPGLVIVISPLIALMKDQVDSLHELGVPATFINSSLDAYEVSHRKDLVKRGAVKLLYVAPERLVMPDFLQFLGTLDLAYFAIDEAHCISEWGHDFRVEYRKLSMLRMRFPKVPIMALTATATTRVAEDIVTQLQISKSASRYKASFNRPNLIYYVKPKGDTFNDLVSFLETHKDESGIIYCMSRASTEGIADRLNTRGMKALAYHAGMTSSQRSKHQEMFIRDQVNIMCATIAFGMGIDKSNVRFVVHYDMSKNIEGYYQETGRAGRDGLSSDCVLFYSPGDKIKMTRLITNDSLPRDVITNNLANLNLMCKYAELRTCRKKMVLEYFGDVVPEDNCGACDNCLGLKTVKGDTVDMTIPAQKFLSTIIRTTQRYSGFGAGYIIDILLGNEKEDRIIHNGHHTLPVFGIGKDLKKVQWQHVARELEQEGYLARDKEHGYLKLTKFGNDIIASKAVIQLAPFPTKTKKSKDDAPEKSRTVTADLPDVNAELFIRLRDLRMAIANEKDVPAYIIFPDSVLKQMAALLPQTKKDLLKLSGVGEKKAADIGDLFLKAISEYVKENKSIKTAKIAGDSQAPPPPAKAKETSLQSALLFNQGKSIAEIADRRAISKLTIADHLAEAIAVGEITSIDRLVTHQTAKKIRTAFSSVNSLFLKPVMEFLDDPSITYDDLKFVRAYDQQLHAKGKKVPS